MKVKQRYERTYEKGRPTNGWDKGERITDVSQVKPGDVLIAVSHQFQAENLVRVMQREEPIVGNGFDYEYVDCLTLDAMPGGRMFCWYWAIHDQSEYYRAIDRRPKNRKRARVRNLPFWLSYKS